MDNPLIRIEPGLFIWTVVTFLVLLGVMAKFVWKPLTDALDRREKRIRQSLKEADEVQQAVERISKEYEEMLRKARGEAQVIVAEGKARTEKIKERMLEKAKEESEHLRKEAEKRIQAEKENALSEIRQEVVNLSLHAASKIIGKNLTKEDNLSLINDSLDKVDRSDAK
ncbi:MAG: F0F1 ATP synthase subunit B [Candidatus Neomarinimicrobiota bacterium]